MCASLPLSLYIMSVYIYMRCLAVGLLNMRQVYLGIPICQAQKANGLGYFLYKHWPQLQEQTRTRGGAPKMHALTLTRLSRCDSLDSRMCARLHTRAAALVLYFCSSSANNDERKTSPKERQTATGTIRPRLMMLSLLLLLLHYDAYGSDRRIRTTNTTLPHHRPYSSCANFFS